MKKWIALLMAAAMIWTSFAAIAQEAPTDGRVTLDEATPMFDVTMTIPEGYTLTKDSIEDVLLLSIDCPAEDEPNFTIAIAYSEEYDKRTYNELSDAEKQELLDVMDDDYMQPQVFSLTTDYGTEVCFINEVYPDNESFYATAFTIYKGYFVHLYIMKPAFAELEQSDLDLAIKILSDMWFVDVQ